MNKNPLESNEIASKPFDVAAWAAAERRRLLDLVLPWLALTMIGASIWSFFVLVGPRVHTDWAQMVLLLLMLVSLVVCWLCWRWNHGDRYALASYSLIALLALDILTLTFLFDSLSLTAALLAPVIVLLATLLRSPQVGYLLILGGAAFGLLRFAADLFGWYEAPLAVASITQSVAEFVAFTVTPVLSVYFLSVTQSSVRRALSRMLVQSETLRLANRRLVAEIQERERAEREAQEREVQWKQLVETIPVAVFVHGADTAVLECNALAADLLGVEVASLRGRKADADWRFIGNDGRMLSSEELPVNRVLDTGQKVADYVFGILRSEEDEPVWVLTNSVPERDASGEIVRVLVTAMDITERRRLLGRLRQAAKMEAVGQLAGGVAHRFNNLMTSVLGYAELLLDSIGRNDVRRLDVEAIRDAAQEAAFLTERLLSFARRQMLQPRRVDLNAVVEAALAEIGEDEAFFFSLSCERDDLIISTEFDRDLEPVQADRLQIRRILQEICRNACEAMPDGGALSVVTERVDLGTEAAQRLELSSGAYARLVVEDTGIGMNAEMLSHLFEPFYTTKKPGEGDGLGLASVYGVVRQSDGAIDVKSAPRQGTTISVYLPLAEPEQDPRQ